MRRPKMRGVRRVGARAVLREVHRLLGRRELYEWRALHWPASLDANTSAAFLRQLAGDHFVPTVVLVVEAADGLASYRLGVPAAAIHRVEQTFTSIIRKSAMTETAGRKAVREAW